MTCCTGGDCCGPGSYCCANTGPHDHPELDDEMTDCTARITTAEVTDEVVAVHRDILNWTALISDGATVQRQGDRLVRVDLQSAVCTDYAGYPQHHVGDVSWKDSCHGAIPHKDDESVSDAEVEAAREALAQIGNNPGTDEGIRAALLAAKRARPRTINIHEDEVRAMIEAAGEDPETVKWSPYTRMLVAAKRAEKRPT